MDVNARLEDLLAEWNERELHKSAVVEILPFSLEDYLQTGEIRPEPSLLLVHYGAGASGGEPEARFYTAPLERFRSEAARRGAPQTSE